MKACGVCSPLYEGVGVGGRTGEDFPREHCKMTRYVMAVIREAEEGRLMASGGRSQGCC